jgi:hypothetical protein
MAETTDSTERYGRVSRNLKYGLVYEWKPIHADQMFSASESVKRWWKVEEMSKENANIVRTKVTIEVYGKKISHNIPTLHWDPDDPATIPDSENNITKDFYSYLVQRAKRKMLSDNIMWVRQSLLKIYNLTLINNTPVFFRLNKDPEQIAKSNQDIDEDEQIRQTALILMKEYMDGYYMEHDYKLSINSIFTKKKLDFPIKKDYDIYLSDFNDTVHIPNNYTAWLRYAIFSSAAQQKWRDPALDADKPQETRPLLQRWQYDVIKRGGKRTLFACPRRQGKTLLMVFLALRAVMKYNPKAQFRPTSVLYIWLTEKALTPVLHYITKMTQAFGEAGEQMFHYDSKYGILSFKEWKNVLGTITFLSAEWRNPGIGFFADHIFIDEAHLIPRDIYDWVEPIITHEWASLTAASTMYKHIKKWRFFDLLVEYEKESMDMNDIDDLIVQSRKDNKPMTHNAGLRYTIDDNEFLPDIEKARIKAQYAKDPIRYLAELYSRFPDEGKIFKYESALRDSTALLVNNYKYVVHGYDPARTQDKSVLITLAYNEHLNKIAILEENTLNKIDNSSYDAQAEQIKNFRKSAEQYVNNPNDIFLSMDWTQKATAEIIELKWIPVHLRVAYHGGINITKTSIRNEMRVPKKHLINVAKILFDNDKILMSNKCLELQREMDAFYELYDDATGSITYSGVGEHDDHVNALLVGLYYIYEHLWLKSILIPQKSTDDTPTQNVTKEDLRKYKKEKEDKKKAEARKVDNEKYFQKFIY